MTRYFAIIDCGVCILIDAAELVPQDELVRLLQRIPEQVLTIGGEPASLAIMITVSTIAATQDALTDVLRELGHGDVADQIEDHESDGCALMLPPFEVAVAGYGVVGGEGRIELRRSCESVDVIASWFNGAECAASCALDAWPQGDS